MAQPYHAPASNAARSWTPEQLQALAALNDRMLQARELELQRIRAQQAMRQRMAAQQAAAAAAPAYMPPITTIGGEPADPAYLGGAMPADGTAMPLIQGVGGDVADPYGMSLLYNAVMGR